MAERTVSDPLFERITEYFQSSRFEYLALDYAGSSLRIAREQVSGDSASRQDALVPAAIARDARVEEVLASSVGFIESAPGRDRLPEAGERVAEGETLFAIRRFRDGIEVKAPAAGSLTCMRVSQGAFVEFGQPLASICRSE